MVSIRDIQKLMHDLYYERDSKRGLERTYIWFVEEVGELGRAILKNDQEGIKEELADVFAWLVSLCNLLNIDLEEVILKKYSLVCPKCKSIPCRCSYRE
ncbi:MAG: nucleotide pyrophosphohydrolase [Thermoprotei archaeon ex4572_64]|nr:MAG: nucleotide pyrophosphohydrolase [Thermoprotei archaeon ex4572_64]